MNFSREKLQFNEFQILVIKLDTRSGSERLPRTKSIGLQSKLQYSAQFQTYPKLKCVLWPNLKFPDILKILIIIRSYTKLYFTIKPDII